MWQEKGHDNSSNTLNIANSAGVAHYHVTMSSFHPMEPKRVQCICDTRWWLTTRDLKRSSWEKISSCRMRLAPHGALCTTPNNWSQFYSRDHLRALGVSASPGWVYSCSSCFMEIHRDQFRSMQLKCIEINHGVEFWGCLLLTSPNSTGSGISQPSELIERQIHLIQPLAAANWGKKRTSP